MTSASFLKLSRIFRSLDNETKLAILALLAEEGAKSVTDISKSLHINFSTAHKYLEDLESSGLVKSKQETKNRLKRMFTVQDFSIRLSPRDIGAADTQVEPQSNLKVVTERGTAEIFNERKFISEYLEQGLPQSIVNAGIKYIRRFSYDGITILELRHHFKEYLKNNINLLKQSVFNLEERTIHKRTFRNILNLLHPDALDKHMNGDIFISNLRYPILRDYVLDIRGLAIHGLNGKRAKNLFGLLDQVLEFIKISSKELTPIYSLTDFNYYIAPYVQGLTEMEITKCLTDFFDKLKEIKQTIYVELDCGVPKYLKDVPLNFLTQNGTGKVKNKANYVSFIETADRLKTRTLEIISENDFTEVVPILKIWDAKYTPKDMSHLRNFYFANMSIYDDENISFIGRLNRFDSSWKSWLGTMRVGEIQNLTLNLPRIALNSKTVEEFMRNLTRLMNDAIEYHLNMAEMTAADFLRHHKTTLDSAEVIKWDYVRLLESLYSISIVGLNETVQILSNKTLETNPKLGERILHHCNSIINGRDLPVRIALKEEMSPIIAMRFYYLDKDKHKGELKKYSIGIGSRDLKVSSLLQKHLPAGHCMTIGKNNFDFKMAINSGVSLFRVI